MTSGDAGQDRQGHSGQAPASGQDTRTLLSRVGHRTFQGTGTRERRRSRHGARPESKRLQEAGPSQPSPEARSGSRAQSWLLPDLRFHCWPLTSRCSRPNGGFPHQQAADEGRVQHLLPPGPVWRRPSPAASRARNVGSHLYARPLQGRQSSGARKKQIRDKLT